MGKALDFLLPWDSQPQEVVELDWGNPDTLSLVGAWPLSDGQFRDATGRNNGTLNAGVTQSVSTLGRTLTFNGTSGAVTLPTPPAGTTLTVTNSSISFWIYPTNLTGFRVIFHQWNGSNGPILYCNGTSLIWQIGPSGGSITAAAGIELDKWQHFVCTFSGANALAIYKNGGLLQSGNPGGVSNAAHTVAAQWGGTTTYGWYSAGQLAMPAMWTRGLSAVEARRQYESGWQLFAPRSIWVPVSAGGGASTITADTGTFTLTGPATGLAASRRLTADAASFALTGNAAGLTAGRKVTADAASFALTGVAAGLLAGRKVTADAASFALTGIDATLTYTPGGGATYTLTAATGAFALTGQAANLIAARALAAQAGAFALAGNDADLVLNPVVPDASESLSSRAKSRPKRLRFQDYDVPLPPVLTSTIPQDTPPTGIKPPPSLSASALKPASKVATRPAKAKAPKVEAPAPLPATTPEPQAVAAAPAPVVTAAAPAPAVAAPVRPLMLSDILAAESMTNDEILRAMKVLARLHIGPQLRRDPPKPKLIRG